MKTLIVAFLFFLLGFGAYWGYNQYQNLLKENQELKKAENKIPSSADESSVSAALTPTKSVEANGKIEGVLGYPSEVIPSLEVYAFDVTDESKYFLVKTNPNQGTFTIEDVTPGTYNVVAYSVGYSNLSGGFSKAVPCGLSVECTDHSLISVTVDAGETTTGVEVRDWYAPEGTFPAKP